MLIQDDKELSPSHIPDCDPPPYSHLTSGSAGVSAVTTDSEFANAPTVKDIRLEKHHELISGEPYIFYPYACLKFDPCRNVHN